MNRPPSTLAAADATPSRVERLRARLKEKGLSACLITHTSNIRWLTGFGGVFDDEQAHLALIFCDLGGAAPNEAVPCLFTDTRYSTALRALDAEGRWRILDERRPRSAYVVETLLVAAQQGSGSGQMNRPLSTLRIGIENDLRLDVYRALNKSLAEQGAGGDIGQDARIFELVETEDLVAGLRSVKDAGEIEALKAAQALTDDAYLHMLDYLRCGLTEREAACELEFFMRRAGADGVAFPSIVASGPNSAVPHAVPGDRVLSRGDFVLMDFGARLGDYRSDMTRTVVLGCASERQKAMYAAVLAAQSAVLAALGPGVRGQEMHELASEVIASHGFAGAFTHALGHGVGLDIHELPTLGPKVETALVSGQVLTVEPGVYLEGVGGVRIEDYGVVTEQGFEVFTRSPHELLELQGKR